MGGGESGGQQPQTRGQEAWEEGEEARGGSSRRESRGRGSQDGGTTGPRYHPRAALVGILALVMWKGLEF